jgi:hypothetical protein
VIDALAITVLALGLLVSLIALLAGLVLGAAAIAHEWRRWRAR